MWALARRDRDGLKEIIVGGVIGGRAVADVDVAGAEFAARVFATRMRPDTVARLRWHRRRGDRIVLVSASLGPYLRPLGKLLDVDAVLCTDVARDGAHYTRRLDGPNCRAAQKAARLTTWLDERGLSTEELWAYGDSAGDVELLALAAHPVWVGSAPLEAVPGGRADSYA
jgi:phosphatidylglycerophosphatase C